MPYLKALLIACIIAVSALSLDPVYAAERSLSEQTIPGIADLESDPAYRWGRLENGLRYVIREHHQPANQVSLRLLVSVGSLEELPEEQGIAHYLEHMAFKGSDHFPDNSFVQVMQRYGVAHGSHSNAHTGFDETVYKLDLPSDDRQALEHGMRWFADVLSTLHLSPEEIEIERGVILAEMRDRNTASFRAAQSHFASRYPGMRLAQRWPIGLEDTVRSIDRDLLMNFWQRWYRPDNSVISIVGDLDKDSLHDLLTSALADVPAAEQEMQAKPRRGSFDTEAERIRFSVHYEDEIGSTLLRIYALQDVDSPPMSLARLEQRILRSLATRILSQRLSEESEKPQSALLDAGVFSWRWHDMLHGAISLRVREQGLAEALAVGIRELRSALYYAPGEDELEQAQAWMLSQAREQVATAANRSSSDLAVAAYQAIKNNEHLFSPEQYLALLEDRLPQIGIDDIQQALRSIFDFEQAHWSIELTAAEAVKSELLRKTWDEAWRQEIPPPQRDALPDWPYQLPDTAAEIVQQEQRDLGITQIRFANEVVANLMPRDEHPEELLWQLRISRQAGSAPAGVRALAERSFLRRGTGALTHSQIRRHLTQSSVSLGVHITDDALIFSGRSLPSDAEQWLLYALALIHDPAWRSDRIEQQRLAWHAEIRGAANDLQESMQRQRALLLSGGDPDRAPVSLETVEALSASAVRSWLEPILKEGAIELAVVGDFEVDSMAQLIAQAFGTLQERQELAVVESLAEAGALLETAAMAPGRQDIQIVAPVLRSEIAILWPGSDMRDIHRVRRLGVLAHALRLGLRETLRSRMGDAYSPAAANWSSDIWKDHGFLIALVSVAPERREEAIQAILEGVRSFAEEGIDEDTFAQVQRPTLTNLRQWRNRNQYWVGQVVGQSWSRPERIDWALGMEEDFAAISIEEINALAATIFSQEPSIITVTGSASEEP